jgi:hypothetical protein
MRFALVSATKRLPDESTAMPTGEEKLEFVPITLSAEKVEPFPAKVVVFPDGVILRMTLLPVSATKIFPSQSTAIPCGELKDADVPIALLVYDAVPLPAKVLVLPFGVTLRIRLPSDSATYTFPARSTARAAGLEKVATEPIALS